MAYLTYTGSIKWMATYTEINLSTLGACLTLAAPHPQLIFFDTCGPTMCSVQISRPSWNIVTAPVDRASTLLRGLVPTHHCVLLVSAY